MKDKTSQLASQAEKNEKLKENYKNQLMSLKLEHSHLQERLKEVKV